MTRIYSVQANSHHNIDIHHWHICNMTFYVWSLMEFLLFVSKRVFLFGGIIGVAMAAVEESP